MWRKLLVGFFIGASLISMGSIGNPAEAASQVKVEQKVSKPVKKTDKVKFKINENKYEIVNPKRTSYSTDNKVAFINGTAPAKTSIEIKVYGTTDLTKNNFNLDKLPSNEDYVEVFKETIEAGNMGFFQKQLDLVMGINKITIDFGADGEDLYEIIVYVYDKAPTLIEMRSRIR